MSFEHLIAQILDGSKLVDESLLHESIETLLTILERHGIRGGRRAERIVERQMVISRRILLLVKLTN